jgi:hypothetical protein
MLSFRVHAPFQAIHWCPTCVSDVSDLHISKAECEQTILFPLFPSSHTPSMISRGRSVSTLVVGRQVVACPCRLSDISNDTSPVRACHERTRRHLTWPCACKFASYAFPSRHFCPFCLRPKAHDGQMRGRARWRGPPIPWRCFIKFGQAVSRQLSAQRIGLSSNR